MAELINLSQTGALIRMTFELRKGGEWPLVLELADASQVWLNGRVVRCRRHEGAFVLALTKRSLPLPWRLPTLSLLRLVRLLLSSSRHCSECHSADVTKERRHAHSCFQCGCRFSGFRIGTLRISL